MQDPTRNATVPRRVLLHHSFVTTGRVGGRLTAAALEHWACDVSFSSTVTLSRHPGLGDAIGDVTPTTRLAANAAHAGAVDAVAIGYAGSGVMFDALHHLHRSADPPVFFDPILGRRPGGLYVPPDAAIAARRLLGVADIVTPNAFELETLSDRSFSDVPGAFAAARTLRDKLRASGPQIVIAKLVEPTAKTVRVLICGDEEAEICAPRAPGRWRGTGDLFFGLLIGGALARDGKARFPAVADAARDSNQWIADALRRAPAQRDGDTPLPAVLSTLAAARQRHLKMGMARSP